MSNVTCQISVSLDGYMAGPDQSVENPLGVGAERLHTWYFGGEGTVAADAELKAHLLDGNGAYIMGRNMFGPIRGEWPDLSWRGWWGEDPPYHTPVFVLTHYAREPLEMEGGTTFHFVTGGFDEALTRAREAAGDRNIAMAGGASTLNQALAAGALDELFLHYSPILLGAGERLFEGLDTPPELEIVETIASPAATHVRYRVVRS
ncbi:MAG TPA: dihydrofolate reductase family protein [Baekduia sp.]|jgi:dihydrofolate reductase